MNESRLNTPEEPTPPDRVLLRSVEIDPYPDRRRLKIRLELTQFQEPPDIEIVILDSAGEEVANSCIIQPTQNVMQPTIHLRRQPIDEHHTARILIRNDESEIETQEEKSFLIPGSSSTARA
jgi:hypothetical protein